MQKKIKIQENTIMETLMFPLYGRARCSKLYPDIFPDKEAEALIDRIDFDFGYIDSLNMKTIEYSLRKRMLCDRAKEYLAKKPCATVVNLGCGLDNSFPDVDNGSCRWINLDLPDIIEARKSLLRLREREKNAPYSAFDTNWFNEVETAPEDGLFVISGGVLIYFDDETVKGLFTSLAEKYPSGGICFDARNEAAVFNTNKFIEISGYSSTCHLAVNSARQKFSEWSDKFAAVSTFRRLPEDVRNAESIPFTIREEMAFAMKMGYFKIIEIGFAASA